MTGEPGIASMPVSRNMRGAGISEASARPAMTPTTRPRREQGEFHADVLARADQPRQAPDEEDQGNDQHAARRNLARAHRPDAARDQEGEQQPDPDRRVAEDLDDHHAASLHRAAKSAGARGSLAYFAAATIAASAAG